MCVLEQGMKLLPTELRCRGSPVSVVQSDEVDLACDKVRKVGGIPFVAELCSEGVLEFLRVEGQGREPVKVLLVTVGEKEGQSRDRVEVDDSVRSITPRVYQTYKFWI